MKNKLKAFCMIVGAILVFSKCLDLGYAAIDWAQGAYYDSREYLCRVPVQNALRAPRVVQPWVKESASRFQVSPEQLAAMIEGDTPAPAKKQKRKG